MKLVFLGTSGMVPTKDRNVQGLYLEYNGEGILLDCGEGTQRQLTLAGISAQKITKILISHWHGDHVAGLLGLLQTMGNFSGQEIKEITLFGPPGSAEFLDHMKQSCIFDVKIAVKVVEISPTKLEKFYENDDYALNAILLDHGVPCLGYQFEKKARRKIDQKKINELDISGPLIGELQSGKQVTVDGKIVEADDVSEVLPAHKIAFVFDTALCDQCYELADGVDVLVSESVYKSNLEHKAIEYKHLTAKQVAGVAAECGVGQLILTHFSQRYKDVDELKEDAKQLFDNVICAYDFLKIDLPF